MKPSNADPIFLDGIRTGVLLKDFAQHLKRKDVAILDIFFILLDAVTINPDLVIHSYAKFKVRRDWILFKI